MSPREQPEQQAPPVQRLRVRYAKRGRLRFTSHRDFSRAFERAVFRARVPMAYSSGFNPHPRISYAGAAPTGSASEAEYLEIALAEVGRPGRDPPGPRRGAARRARRARGRRVARRRPGRPARGQPLGDRPPRRPARRGQRAVDAFLAAEAVLGGADDEEGAARLRLPGRGRLARRVGARAGLPARPGAPSQRARRSGPTTYSPGCASSADLDPGPAPLLTRLAQGPLEDDGTVGDPLGFSR